MNKNDANARKDYMKRTFDNMRNSVILFLLQILFLRLENVEVNAGNHE